MLYMYIYTFSSSYVWTRMVLFALAGFHGNPQNGLCRRASRPRARERADVGGSSALPARRGGHMVSTMRSRTHTSTDARSIYKKRPHTDFPNQCCSARVCRMVYDYTSFISREFEQRVLCNHGITFMLELYFSLARELVYF